MMLRVPLPTRRATRQLAQALGRQLQVGDLVILTGELGAGKTFFVRALARSLGLDTNVRVTSPTFALVQELETRPPLAHADLYRLTGVRQLTDTGLEAMREQAVLIVEWGAPYAAALGGDALELKLTPEPRHAELHADGERSHTILKALEQGLAPSGAAVSLRD